MERGERLAKAFAATATAFTLALWAIYWAYARGGFVADTLNTAFRPPLTPTKVLIVVAALLTFIALPIALAEGRAERRFARTEQALRAERLEDAVSPYEGPEGRGVLFDGPGGRTLVLEPAGGLGHPRVIELSPPAERPPAPESAAVDEGAHA